jgi:formylglycine-generating enzyme
MRLAISEIELWPFEGSLMKANAFATRIGCALAVALSTCSAGFAIDIETVLVGNPGNAGDNRVMNDGTSGYGGVAYEYRIGKYEVTNDEFAVFLNAIATTDTFEIYEPFFMGAALYGGILRSGGAPNYVYTVEPNMGDKPVMGVTTPAAMRFANWLHNGQPSGSQTTATTEAGTYDLTGTNLPLTRSSSATWWIPNDNEWYKAAYYDPRDTASGGPPGDSHYWLHATKTIGTPTAATADATGNIANPGPTTVNYNSNANWNGSAPFGNVTTVGSAGLSSASYFGTFDQAGNAAEHNDTPTQFGPNTRVVRGGHYTSLSDAISAAVRGYCGGCYAGLRVASVLNPPGPGGLLAYWNAENGAVDVTGNGHDGTFQGDATTTPNGPFGNAFTFDGNGDYINIGDELDVGTSDFTLSAWLKGDPTMNQWGRIFDKGFSSGYTLGARAGDNTIAFEFLASGSQGNVFDTATNLIDNTWHHVALVKAGTSVTIYADGVAENTQTVSGAAQNNALPLLIGYNPGEGIIGYWKGLLDELKIFGSALTLAEIQALAVNPNEDLPGDYNDNGVVDTADYVVWRKHLNTSTTLPNDATAGVSPVDYNVWRAHFGESNGSGAALAAAVPEPASATLLAFALACTFRPMCGWHRRIIRRDD